MFNTGTVAGVCANIFGSGFPPKHIPSFAWGGAEGFKTAVVEQVFSTCQRMMERRHVQFTKLDEDILLHVLGATAAQRN